MVLPELKKEDMNYGCNVLLGASKVKDAFFSGKGKSPSWHLENI